MTQVEMCNMSISHLGSGETIGDMDERSEEARACSTFWDVAFEATLRDFAWPFAKKFVELELVEENPNNEWLYSYRYPTSILKIRRILSGSRKDTKDTEIKFVEAQDGTGQLIFTDQDEAEAECTMKITDLSRLPPDFIMAFSYRLAFYIAPRITGGNAFERIKLAMWASYQKELGMARSSSADEERPDNEPESEFITIRG